MPLPNPSAFPHPAINEANPGMTLRDYFAAAALTGIIAAIGSVEAQDSIKYGLAAQDSYKFADKMLAERAKADNQ